MSRYTLLFLLNLPFIFAAVLSQVTQYKLGKSSKVRLRVQLVIWAFILAGLVFAESIYNWLFTKGLTQTDSLSLFDVIQITAIVMLYYIVNRFHQRIDTLEHRLNDLHQQLSIRLSKKD